MKDYFGKPIKVGDIVLKATRSDFTLHKVMGFTKDEAAIKLSQRREIFEHLKNVKKINSTNSFLVQTNNIHEHNTSNYLYYPAGLIVLNDL